MVCGAGKNIWTPPRNSGRIPSTRFSVSIENEQADKRRYSQTCLAKPNSQARTGARKLSPVQLTINRIGNLTQLICTLLYVMTTHTCIRILYCRVYPQLPPVIGAPWGLKKNLNAFVAGTLRGYFLPVRLRGYFLPVRLRGYFLPVRYGSVGVQLTRLRALYQGTLTSGCVWKNLNTSYLYNAAILASFFLFACLKACFRLSLSTRNKKKRTITSKKHAYRPETSYVLYYSLNHICCAASLKPVSFQAHSQHHKGSIYHCCGCLGDMWRARVLFWGAPLQDADQLRVFLSTGNNGDFSDHNGQL